MYGSRLLARVFSIVEGEKEKPEGESVRFRNGTGVSVYFILQRLAFIEPLLQLVSLNKIDLHDGPVLPPVKVRQRGEVTEVNRR